MNTANMGRAQDFMYALLIAHGEMNISQNHWAQMLAVELIERGLALCVDSPLDPDRLHRIEMVKPVTVSQP